VHRSGYMAVEHLCFIIEAYELSLVKLSQNLNSKEHCRDVCVKHDLNILRTPCFFNNVWESREIPKKE